MTGEVEIEGLFLVLQLLGGWPLFEVRENRGGLGAVGGIAVAVAKKAALAAALVVLHFSGRLDCRAEGLEQLPTIGLEAVHGAGLDQFLNRRASADLQVDALAEIE